MKRIILENLPEIICASLFVLCRVVMWGISEFHSQQYSPKQTIEIQWSK